MKAARSLKAGILSGYGIQRSRSWRDLSSQSNNMSKRLKYIYMGFVDVFSNPCCHWNFEFIVCLASFVLVRCLMPLLRTCSVSRIQIDYFAKETKKIRKTHPAPPCSTCLLYSTWYFWWYQDKSFFIAKKNLFLDNQMGLYEKLVSMSRSSNVCYLLVVFSSATLFVREAAAYDMYLKDDTRFRGSGEHNPSEYVECKRTLQRGKWGDVPWTSPLSHLGWYVLLDLLVMELSLKWFIKLNGTRLS